MTVVQCSRCDHVWDTPFQSYCKCPSCKASQLVQDMRQRYLTQTGRNAPTTPVQVQVQVQPVPAPNVNRNPLVEERANEAPRAGVPVAEQYSEIAKRMKGGVKW